MKKISFLVSLEHNVFRGRVPNPLFFPLLVNFFYDMQEKEIF